MPKSTITDLDELFSAPRKVRLAGTTYTLPPDAPIETVLRHQQLTSEQDSLSVDDVKQMYADVLELFRYKQPDLQALPITMVQLVLAVRLIYTRTVGEVNLDAVLPPDKKVKLGGRNYTLPGDLYVNVFIAINTFDDEDPAAVTELMELVLGLFRYKQPQLKTLPLGYGQLLAAVGTIYRPDPEPQAPKAARGKTSGGSPRRKSSTPSASVT